MGHGRHFFVLFCVILSAHNGDISGLYYDEDLWTQTALRNLHPMVLVMQQKRKEGNKALNEPSYGFDNGVPGLTLAIDGWHGHKIEIESFASSGNSYFGTLRFTFYDHFGLNIADLTEWRKVELWNMEIKVMRTDSVPAFRQWYIIQHWDELNADVQPKPFITHVTYTVSFSGTY